MVVEVKAQDSVLSAKSSTTTITINVQDVNDNAPEFAKTSYSAAVKENEPASTIITSDIEASDVDTKLGGVITYSIVSSTPSGNLDKFTINGTTGKCIYKYTYCTELACYSRNHILRIL